MHKAKVRNIFETGLGCILKIFPRVKSIIINKLTIFVYHNITNTPSDFNKAWGLSVSINTFQNQISWIKDNFNIIHPNDLLSKSHLPNKSAVITFDDGFAGAFENGITHLVKKSIPSAMYLNMGSIIEERPILSAVVDYLDKNSSSFKAFAKNQNLKKPYFLSITPTLLNQYEKENGPLNFSAIRKYQGPIANISTVKNWCGEELVVFGNHLYDHWNSAALNSLEFKEQYLNNERELKKLNINNTSS